MGRSPREPESRLEGISTVLASNRFEPVGVGPRSLFRLSPQANALRRLMCI